MRLRLTVIMMTTLGGVLVACGDGSAERSSGRAATPSSSDVTHSAPVTTPAPGSTSATATCDRDEALSAVLASGAAEGPGQIDYLECLDGFGWALYTPDGVAETGHVILSIHADGYQVLDLGTSICAFDSGVPTEVALAIAPTRGAATDCPEPSSAAS